MSATGKKVAITGFKATYTGTSISHTAVEYSSVGQKKEVTATGNVQTGQEVAKLAMHIKN